MEEVKIDYPAILEYSTKKYKLKTPEELWKLIEKIDKMKAEKDLKK